MHQGETEAKFQVFEVESFFFFSDKSCIRNKVLFDVNLKFPAETCLVLLKKKNNICFS